ncbi:MAG: hypothetical protein K6E33_07345, partial [Lachnospiraceae bacterium]|nr:hypothetical protein [Lachnospiraceae bacterium]
MQIKFSEGVDTLNFRKLNPQVSQMANNGVQGAEKAGYSDVFDLGARPGANERIERDIKSAASGNMSAGDVQNLSDYMTVVANTVSDEDYARMMKEGFDPG